MKYASIILFVVALTTAGWYFWKENSSSDDLVSQILGPKDIITLEARYTPQQIIDKNRQELKIDAEHTLLEPSVKFYPYLLMDVKYSLKDNKTREGIILWSLQNGEMVLNTETWDITHGFADCIAAKATKGDFIIINALAQNPNFILTRDELIKALPLQPSAIDDLLESALDKHLIAQSSDTYFLHFQNPKLNVIPQTTIVQSLVTKGYTQGTIAEKKYSRSQIEKVAKAAFGDNFTIRNTREVFLPVISIEIQNPDGTVLSTLWNAINAQRIVSAYLANKF